MNKLLAIFLLTIMLPFKSWAMSSIRDSEIEFILREITRPIFTAAELSPKSIKIDIIQSDELNAFVMGGQNIFITTKLLQYSDDPETILGVIAHEVGHISGGHLITTKEEMNNLRKKMLLGLFVGAAAGAATGSTDAAIGAGMGSSNAPIGGFLKFNRTQESAADQAGIKVMTKLGISPNGLIKFLKDLGSHERHFFNDENPYLRTHPVSQDRIDAINNYVKHHPITTSDYPGSLAKAKFKRAIAKLYAYTQTPEATFRKYAKDDLDSYYAKAIAYMKQANFKKSLEYVDKVMDAEPISPFIFELKGQVLFESGDYNGAIEAHKKAYTFAPRENLLKMEYAKSLIAAKLEVSKAITLLEQILEEERGDIQVWQQLALAYGLKKDKTNSNLAQGWVQLLTGDIPLAKRFLALAKKEAGNNAELKRKINDLKTTIDTVEYEEASLGD